MPTSDFDKATSFTWDAIVVGAGPAGSVAALELARRGSQVLLVDKKPFPRWKVCGACLSGQSVSMLEQIGLKRVLERLHGVPLDRFRLRAGTSELEVCVPTGLAVSRPRLDAALVTAATDAGVRFLPETTASVGPASSDNRFVALWQDSVAADVAARVVLVADGLGHPSLTEHAAFRSVAGRHARIGAGCVLTAGAMDLPRGTIHMIVGQRGYLGMVRVADGTVNVAAALDPTYVRRAGGLGPAADAMLQESPIRGVPRLADEQWRGTPVLTQQPGSVAGRRLFVLGDAAGYVEPFTGEGMARAIESAVALAPLAHRAITAWHDELATTWAHMHVRLVQRRLWLCRLIAWALKHPVIVRAGMQFMGRVPALAQGIASRVQAPVALFQG